MPLITTTGGGSVRGLGRGRGESGSLMVPYGLDPSFEYQTWGGSNSNYSFNTATPLVIDLTAQANAYGLAQRGNANVAVNTFGDWCIISDQGFSYRFTDGPGTAVHTGRVSGPSDGINYYRMALSRGERLYTGNWTSGPTVFGILSPAGMPPDGVGTSKTYNNDGSVSANFGVGGDVFCQFPNNGHWLAAGRDTTSADIYTEEFSALGGVTLPTADSYGFGINPDDANTAATATRNNLIPIYGDFLSGSPTLLVTIDVAPHINSVESVAFNMWGDLVVVGEAGGGPTLVICQRQN